MSPLEHAATPFTEAEWTARDLMAAAALTSADQTGLDPLVVDQMIGNTQFNGNFRGWTQLRKLVRGENDFGAVERS